VPGESTHTHGKHKESSPRRPTHLPTYLSIYISISLCLAFAHSIYCVPHNYFNAFPQVSATNFLAERWLRVSFDVAGGTTVCVRKWVGGQVSGWWVVWCGAVPTYVKHAGQQAKLLGQPVSQSLSSSLGVQSPFEILARSSHCQNASPSQSPYKGHNFERQLPIDGSRETKINKNPHCALGILSNTCHELFLPLICKPHSLL